MPYLHATTLFMRIRFRKPSRRRVLITLLVLFIAGIGAGALLFTNPALAAQFADTVLRPLLGSERTIVLENKVFALQDHLNQAEHKQAQTADYLPSVATVSGTPTPAPGPSAAPEPTPPAAITPMLSPALANEGRWSRIAGTNLYTTFIRTDPTRAYSVTNLVYIPMNDVSIGAVAGTKYPGGPAGPGKVPANVQAAGTLIAAFNGGFQGKDGHYGMEVNGTTYVPLRANLPVIRLFKDGRADLVTYDGKPFPTDVIAARQNGPLLLSNGKDSIQTTQGIDLWAGTADGGYITWRSGLGFTADGNLIYAVGPSLTPTALADALRLGSAQTALQLDINPFWVRFMVYTWKGTSYSSAKLIPALADGGQPYLTGYEKDFFYLYKK